MEWGFRIVEVVKKYPLAISRGVQATSDNLFVTVSDGVHTGIGELSPATASAWTGERGHEQLSTFVRGLPEGLSIVNTWARMKAAQIDPPAMAALDIALWDLFGKQAGQPLYRVFGLGKPTVATSVTIGINPPEVIRERVPDILGSTGAKALKIKLGSSQGIETDKANFMAASESAAPFHAKLRVDANGGWSVADARHMLQWLAERGADYVEQPLVEGSEDALTELFEGRPLPIFVDESIRFSPDVVKVAGKVDGINLKLMKCGGLTEAVRIVATARAHGLKTMIGCMSETSVAIAAGAHIGALFDHIDLDSHLNLAPDPATGAPIDADGIIMPSDAPGHGAALA
jgi:L-Ala-D/L-Glu epimerase / N-acetyl-D-glutamate racemase